MSRSARLHRPPRAFRGLNVPVLARSLSENALCPERFLGRLKTSQSYGQHNILLDIVSNSDEQKNDELQTIVIGAGGGGGRCRRWAKNKVGTTSTLCTVADKAAPRLTPVLPTIARDADAPPRNTNTNAPRRTIAGSTFLPSVLSLVRLTIFDISYSSRQRKCSS